MSPLNSFISKNFAIATTFPKTSTEGLVLHLDAGNRTSYSGSGTNWKDLSGKNNDVTLTNGPIYNNSNGGNIVFDGSNDYADFFAPNLGTTATVEMWCKIGSLYSNKMFFGWNLQSVWCGSGHLGYNTAASDVYGISSTMVTNLGLVNNWKHYVFEMRSDVSYVNNKIYVNTNLQSLSQQLGSEDATNRNFNGGNGRIAIWRANAIYAMPMNCAIFKVYNKALTTTEIKQNFNALRGRFGV